MGDLDKLRRLRDRAAASKARTAAASKARGERRAKRKGRVPVLPEEMPSDDKPINSTDVKRWFDEGVLKLRGSNWVIPSWTVKERSLAKRILADYGPELTEKAVAHFCSTWEATCRRSNGRLVGDPSVNLLWAMRTQVFPVVQGAKPLDAKNADEHDAAMVESDTPDDEVGW